MRNAGSTLQNRGVLNIYHRREHLASYRYPKEPDAPNFQDGKKMFSRKTAPLRKSTANALSSAILMFLFLGFVPPGAQAYDVSVEGEVSEEDAVVIEEASPGACELDISQTGFLDLGTPTLVTPGGSSPYYLFLSPGGINVTWNVTDTCAASLHAERGDLVMNGIIQSGNLGLRRASDIDGIFTNLDGLMGSAQVESSLSRTAGGTSSFDVSMQIDQETGPGVYRSMISFTVVVG